MLGKEIDHVAVGVDDAGEALVPGGRVAAVSRSQHVAANGEIIGRSETYTTAQARDHGIQCCAKPPMLQSRTLVNLDFLTNRAHWQDASGFF